MCGSDDRLLPEVQNVPVCATCGFKTSPFFVNPSFIVRRRTFDISFTYDGYAICSLKFREAVVRAGLIGGDSRRCPVIPSSTCSFRARSFSLMCGGERRGSKTSAPRVASIAPLPAQPALTSCQPRALIFRARMFSLGLATPAGPYCFSARQLGI
jgi:hypothetical protein